MGGYISDSQGNVDFLRFQRVFKEMLVSRFPLKNTGIVKYTRDKYYTKYLHIPNNDEAARKKVALTYIEGLNWLLKTYLKGCPSWGWFYPHSQPPYLEDLVKIEPQEVNFEIGAPLSPFQGLVFVLRPGSKKLLPESLQEFIASVNSPLIKFPNNKKENPTPGKFCKSLKKY